jgi:NhaP-type Na+/H+ or K+/H+ antiporter
MPITCGFVAVITHVVTNLDWTESFLVGALLSPTDPVLSSSVVTNPRVPRLIRHSLNLESGLNDGLALPPVLALSAALAIDGDDFTVWSFVLQDIGLGVLVGLAVALAASLLSPPRGAALFGLAVAAATYGLALLAGGNGFIAVFVGAIVLGIRRDSIQEAFEAREDHLVTVVKLGVFFVFGALLTFDGLFGDGWAAVAIVAGTLLVARPVAVFVSLAGTRLGTDVKAFMAWFGPKGVATMTFALIVLGEQITDGERIFNIAALAVFTSILLHGLTDRAGSEWMARRAERPAPAP